MAYEDANEKAFQGGDTEPETAKLIQARNEALQGLHDQQTEAGKARQEAHDAALQSALDAEEAVNTSYSQPEEPNLSGAPVPAEAPKTKAAAKSS